MPTPWPYPPPSTVTVSAELARPKRSEGNAIGRSPGIGNPALLALEMKSAIAMDWVVGTGGGAVVVVVVDGGGWPALGAEVDVVGAGVGCGGGGWRTW